MFRWSVAHGLSPALDEPASDAVVGGTNVVLEEAEMDEFRTGRCARFPRRCISRETSYNQRYDKGYVHMQRGDMEEGGAAGIGRACSQVPTYSTEGDMGRGMMIEVIAGETSVAQRRRVTGPCA